MKNPIRWEVVPADEMQDPESWCTTRHAWLVTIDEGHVHLSPAEPCNGDRCEPPEDYMWNAEQPIATVRLEARRDCPGSGFDGVQSHGYSCDCNVWFEMIPDSEIPS